MTIDPNRYVASYPTVKRLYERAIAEGTKDQIAIIAELSIATYVHIIAISLYVQKEFGDNVVLSHSIVSLITFYKCDKVMELE